MSWASQNPKESGFPESQAYMQKRIGLDTYYTCIPHKADGEATP